MDGTENKANWRSALPIWAAVATILMLLITIDISYFPGTKSEEGVPKEGYTTIDSTLLKNQEQEYSGTLDLQNRTNSSRLLSFRRLKVDELGNEIWTPWETRTIARESGKSVYFDNRIELRLSMKDRKPMIYSFIVQDYHCVEFEWSGNAKRWQLIPCAIVDLHE